MSGWKRTAAVLGIALAVPGVALLGPGAPEALAQHAGRNCGVDLISPNGAQANCGRLAASEQVRVEITCDGFWGDYTRVGPWVSGRSTSRIYCDKTADDRLSAGYNISQPA
jgi:hypothetical protein